MVQLIILKQAGVDNDADDDADDDNDDHDDDDNEISPKNGSEQ